MKEFAVVADQVSLLAAQSAEETATGLEHVLEGAKTITVKVDEIAKISKEQADSINQINSGIVQINDVVQNNSANE